MKLSAPLSTSQFGIYVECADHNGEPFYNLPYIYVLDGSLDGERLLAAIETAFKAHPTLFTRIELNNDGEPVQTLDMDNEPWSLAIEDIDDIEQELKELGFTDINSRHDEKRRFICVMAKKPNKD